MQTEQIREYFEKSGWQLSLSEQQLEQLCDYYQLLIEWNSYMNLTAITEEKEVLSKHFADSLAAGRLCPMKVGTTLLDVGTGAGFPSIPLKIVYPELEVTMIDSLQKRVRFLDTVIKQLELNGITAVHGRVEDIAHNKAHREAYDIVASRAVANLSALAEYCLPFVKPGGTFLAYKSDNYQEEADAAAYAIHMLGGELREVYPYLLPETEIRHVLLRYDKVSSTPAKYPRKAGLPTKDPLRK